MQQQRQTPNEAGTNQRVKLNDGWELEAGTRPAYSDRSDGMPELFTVYLHPDGFRMSIGIEMSMWIDDDPRVKDWFVKVGNSITELYDDLLSLADAEF